MGLSFRRRLEDCHPCDPSTGAQGGERFFPSTVEGSRTKAGIQIKAHMDPSMRWDDKKHPLRHSIFLAQYSLFTSLPTQISFPQLP